MRRARLGALAALAVLIAFPAVARAGLSWSSPAQVNDGVWASMDSVSCPAASECAAVDVMGREVTFDPEAPGGWSGYAIDPGEPLSGVACPAATQCTAVDRAGSEVSFDPASTRGWSRSRVDPGHSLRGVSCPSSAQCTAVDEAGQEVTFDPASPAGANASPLGQTELSAIDCPSISQCTALDSGYSRGGGRVASQRLVTFDPSAPAHQTVLDLPANLLLHTLVCPSRGECVAAGFESDCNASGFCQEPGTTMAIDPASPGSPSPVSRTPVAYVSLACPSAVQCTAMDESGQEVTFDPTASNPPRSQDRIDTFGAWNKGNNAAALACVSVSSCVLVSLVYGGIEMTFDPAAPGAPAAVPIDDGAPQVAISCRGAGWCVALAQMQPRFAPGPVGVAAFFAPGASANPTGQAVALGVQVGFSCPAARQCTILTQAGGGGRGVTFNPRLSRQSVRVGELIDTVAPTGLSCPDSRLCVAVDVDGREVTFDPRGRGHPVPRRLVRASLTAIACSSSTECVAIDGAGQEVSFDPTAATTARLDRIDGPRRLVGLACPSASRCTAVDADGAQVTFDPHTGRAQARRRIDTSQITAVSCPSKGFCVAVDASGRALQGDPRRPAPWAAATLPGAGRLLSVSCISTRECVAGDADGHIFTGRD